jgi:hypothetical protein
MGMMGMMGMRGMRGMMGMVTRMASFTQNLKIEKRVLVKMSNESSFIRFTLGNDMMSMQRILASTRLTLVHHQPLVVTTSLRGKQRRWRPRRYTSLLMTIITIIIPMIIITIITMRIRIGMMVNVFYTI